MNAMRWIRVLTLGGVALLAGCLGAESVDCPGGVVCPRETTCASAPVYCARVEQVAACDGKNLGDFERCDFGKNEAGEVIPGACRGGACFQCTTELAGCASPGWTSMVAPTTSATLKDIWVADRAAAFAVGTNTVLRYDGFAWIAEMAPQDDLISVWGSDLQTVYAASNVGSIYKRAEDGTWAVVHSSGGRSLTALGGSGPDDVIAISSDGAIFRFNGANWSMPPTQIPGFPALYAIWSRSRDDAYIVGSNTILHSSGSQWVPMTGTPSTTLRSVVATPTAAFAIGVGIGSMMQVYTLDAVGTWTSIVVPGIPAQQFNGIWASDGAEVHAVGQGGTIIRRDQAGWHQVTSPTGLDLNAVDGSDPGNVFAAGIQGTILRYTGD
ncbi:MAG: hypothetical protein H6Q90_6687 [Deltaproteobacteria bacterium]|nr:hypothetical protein [Deltaproteobacteria bacterium]